MHYSRRTLSYSTISHDLRHLPHPKCKLNFRIGKTVKRKYLENGLEI